MRSTCFTGTLALLRGSGAQPAGSPRATCTHRNSHSFTGSHSVVFSKPIVFCAFPLPVLLSDCVLSEPRMLGATEPVNEGAFRDASGPAARGWWVQEPASGWCGSGEHTGRQPGGSRDREASGSQEGKHDSETLAPNLNPRAFPGWRDSLPVGTGRLWPHLCEGQVFPLGLADKGPPGSQGGQCGWGMTFLCQQGLCPQIPSLLLSQL